MIEDISRRAFLGGMGSVPAVTVAQGNPISLTVSILQEAKDRAKPEFANVYLGSPSDGLHYLSAFGARHLFPSIYEDLHLRCLRSAKAACWALAENGDGIAIVDCQTFLDAVEVGQPLVSVAQLSTGWPYRVVLPPESTVTHLRGLHRAQILVNGWTERRAAERLIKLNVLHGSTVLNVRDTVVDDLNDGYGTAALISEIEKADLEFAAPSFRYLAADLLAKRPRSCVVAHFAALNDRDFAAALKRFLLTLNAAVAFIREAPDAALEVIAAQPDCQNLRCNKRALASAIRDELTTGWQTMGVSLRFGRHKANDWKNWLNCEPSTNEAALSRFRSGKLFTDAHLSMGDRGLTRFARLSYAVRG